MPTDIPNHPLAGPLCLCLDTQGWHASTQFYMPDPRDTYFGCFPTVAAADAHYRFAAGLADGEITSVYVFVNGVTSFCMTIIDGRIVGAPSDHGASGNCAVMVATDNKI